MVEIVTTVVGNLTTDPELRFTPAGHPVASFTIASTPRSYDRQTGEWRDGETVFLPCSCWRQMAENVAESLQRGTRVIASGRLKARSYETRDGDRRTVLQLEVDEIGPTLKNATCTITKTAIARGNTPNSRGGGETWASPSPSGPDPWATQPPAHEEPPF